MALTRMDLDITVACGCSNPECTHKHDDEEMYINQKCHPEAPIQCRYSPRTGILTFECASCEQTIIKVKVEEP